MAKIKKLERSKCEKSISGNVLLESKLDLEQDDAQLVQYLPSNSCRRRQLNSNLSLLISSRPLIHLTETLCGRYLKPVVPQSFFTRQLHNGMIAKILVLRELVDPLSMPGMLYQYIMTLKNEKASSTKLIKI